MDIEGYEWETVRTLIRSSERVSIKQLLVEFHTNKYKHQKMEKKDFLYMFETLKALEKFGFAKFKHHHQNGCCLRFNVMTTPQATKIGKLCCYEILYLNTKFIASNSSKLVKI